MEPQISDTKAKPMRYAGFLSFLEKFIFVPNQSNKVWRLRLRISTTFRIMAVAVGILFCYSLLPASLKVNFSGFNNHQISHPEIYFTDASRSDPEHNTGAGKSVIDIVDVLGPNRSDPVWQLRLLAAFSLVVHATMGVLFLPRDLLGVHATYRRVMLITSFAAPIVVAVISLLISLWVEHAQSNWITGLSVANFSMLGGRLAVYWAFKPEIDTIRSTERHREDI